MNALLTKSPAPATPAVAELADQLMLSGVMRECPDCRDERIFTTVDDTLTDELCCTWCGAAVLIAAIDDASTAISHVA